MLDAFSAAGFFVHIPCGPRKSGIAESVEIPAPVNTTIRSESATASRAARVPVGNGTSCATPTLWHRRR